MALVFADGFDGYGGSTTYFYRYGYTSVGGLDSGQGRFGGIAVRLSSLNAYIGNFQTPIFNIKTNDVRLALWTKSSNFVYSSSRPIIRLTDQSSAFGFSVGLDSSGRLVVQNIKTSTDFGASDGSVRAVNVDSFNPITISDGQYHHIEVRFIASNTATGLVQAWVDGKMTHDYQNVITVTGTTDTVNNSTTMNLSAALIGFSSYTFGGSASAYWDDIVIWDNEGPEMNTSIRLGPHRIRSLFPVANGTYQQFRGVANTGGNWNAVDSIDDDTSYAEGNTAGLKDSYTFTTINSNPTLIHALTIRSHLRNPDVGDKNFSIFLKSGDLEVNSNTQIMNVPFSYYFAPNAGNAIVYHTNPNTGTVWTASTLANTEIGIKVEN